MVLKSVIFLTTPLNQYLQEDNFMHKFVLSRTGKSTNEIGILMAKEIWTKMVHLQSDNLFWIISRSMQLK